ncbi:MAG: 2TM domain-containing protein [Acidovorax sp.]|nr:MAG: 2TM domain-containing protein [Acidovorax sp.]
MRHHRFDHDTALDPIERQARRRAGAKLGWYMHAGVYLLVNLLLVTLSATSGRHWAVYPALGWGLGLAIHGMVVFVVSGSGLHERMVQAERNRLAVQQEQRL